MTFALGNKLVKSVRFIYKFMAIRVVKINK